MRITVDLTKASTEIVDLSSKLNPRVGDGGLTLPFHVLYDDNVVDMHDKDIEFISQDPDGHDIYVSGTVDTSTPGDNAYQGDVTLKFPNGTFKKAGTYDTNKTMFRIVNKSDNSVISTVNVKLTVLDDGSTEFNFDPTKTGYNSRMEDMLNDFKEEHDKKIASINQEGQQAADDAKAKAEATLDDVKDKAKQSLADITSQAQQGLDEIKQLSNEAKGNVAGDTATTAKQAKEQATMNAGLLHDHDEEISAARGRYMKLADRENAQDDEINRKEDRQNANENYAALQMRDDAQDKEIAKKAGKFELEAKLAQMDIHPEVFENSAALQAKYPNGAPGMMVTADTEHKYIYLNNQWEDKGPFVFNDLNPKDKELLYKRSSNNILVNPDLIDNAEGWGITSDWVEDDPTHSIGKSMAYSCSLTEDPQKEISIYQEGIPVKGKQKLSMGVQVIADNTGTAKMQVIFRDENDSIIENSSAGVILSTIEKRGQQKKVENINIPDEAVTAAFTISTSSKGLVIICRPQINFGEKLIPYSILEMNNERIDVNNILVNPDLIDNAEGWGIASDWVEDPTHSIGKSMAYSCSLTEDPQKEISIYQEGIPVKGKQKLSMGVQVIADNTGTAKMQVIFRDENDSIIENSSAGIIFSTIEKRGLQKKLENIKIPDNAVTADFTISTSSKGLVIICRPQINFGEKLIPYSTLEINNERIDVDNILVNPDLIDDAEGWAITSGWEEDPTHSIGKSMAYGCSRDEKSTEKTIIYQKDISVINRTVLSAAVEAITTSNDCRAGLQIIFRNSQGEVLADGMHSLEFSHTLNGFEKFKIENINIPDNAATAAFTISFEGTGVVIICRPQIVFNEKIIPYSLSEITTEQQSKANSVLPQFNIGISVSKVSDEMVKAPFSFQRNGQEINGFVKIAIHGDSSRFHDKKNYKIKVFSDKDCKEKLKLRLMPSWPKTDKFNLKANFIDATQSRNLASAKLVADAAAVTPIADPTVESHLAKTSNFGQMEGFPIEVYFDGAYNGLYTFNTKKDDKVFGLDADKPGNAAVSILDDVAHPATQLLAVPTAKLDNVAYADELHDTPDPELVANWSKWLNFLNNSSDEDFKNKLSSYIDVKSAINVYLFGIMSREYDYNTKSVLYLTWNNGKYFYLVPYDLDSNWGQSADGKIEGNPTEDDKWRFATETSTKTDGLFINNASWSKLFERMYNLFMPEIKEQYTYLRSNVWQTDRLLNAYRDFMNGIPQEAYQKDQELWPQIPSVTTNTYEQLHQVIVQRSNQMDKWIKTK